MHDRNTDQRLDHTKKLENSLSCLIRYHYHCLRNKFSFSAVVPSRAFSQKLLFKWTTTDRRILSTTSLILFEVLLSMIVLSASQVQHQSWATRNDQQHWWCQRNLSRTVVCVFFFCETGCLSFSVSPCPPVCLASRIPLRHIDFLWVSPLCQESDLQRRRWVLWYRDSRPLVTTSPFFTHRVISWN